VGHCCGGAYQLHILWQWGDVVVVGRIGDGSQQWSDMTGVGHRGGGTQQWWDTAVVGHHSGGA
jgi:hypothetical protein